MSTTAQGQDQHARELEAGERFSFGGNWQRFLSVLDDDRIAEAERSLQDWLGAERLDGLTMVDAGSGSGLFSLAAKRLGVARLHSFDFDPQSVACTRELRRRYFADDASWAVEHGSVLDREYLNGLGQFDLVYSWGVLHHTGDMKTALDNAGRLVAPGGRLFISIYNDQGLKSRIWHRIKRIYNALPRPLQLPFTVLVMGPRELMSAGLHTLLLHPHDYVRSWTQYKRSRGMSRWHDLVDWVGGYPFEVAKPEEIFDFYRARGFTLERMRTSAGGLGTNEYLFRRT